MREDDAVVFGPPIRTEAMAVRLVGSRRGTPLIAPEDDAKVEVDADSYARLLALLRAAKTWEGDWLHGGGQDSWWAVRTLRDAIDACRAAGDGAEDAPS